MARQLHRQNAAINRIVYSDRPSYGLAERFELLVGIATAGYQLAFAPFDVSKRPKAIVLQLEQPIRVVEWLGTGATTSSDLGAVTFAGGYFI